MTAQRVVDTDREAGQVGPEVKRGERLRNQVGPAAMVAINSLVVAQALGETVAQSGETTPVLGAKLDGHKVRKRDLVVEGFPSRDDQVGATLWSQSCGLAPTRRSSVSQPWAAASGSPTRIARRPSGTTTPER